MRQAAVCYCFGDMAAKASISECIWRAPDGRGESKHDQLLAIVLISFNEAYVQWQRIILLTDTRALSNMTYLMFLLQLVYQRALVR